MGFIARKRRVNNMNIEYKSKAQALQGLRDFSNEHSEDTQTQIYMNVYESGFCQYVALTRDFKMTVSHWFYIITSDIDVDTFKQDHDGFNSYFATIFLDRRNDSTYTLYYTAFTSLDKKLVIEQTYHE